MAMSLAEIPTLDIPDAGWRIDERTYAQKKALLYTGLCGADGDRTRDLRRDRPAF
jgi:hypothetical protein